MRQKKKTNKKYMYKCARIHKFYETIKEKVLQKKLLRRTQTKKNRASLSFCQRSSLLKNKSKGKNQSK